MPFEPLVAAPALLWWAVPFALGWRLRATPRLRDVPSHPITPAGEAVPRVSIILPARNEAAHIEGCLRSLQQSTWPHLEIIVVDDHSTDGTGALARAVAGDDARLRVVEAPDLPAGWFGKQWACHIGAAHASGNLMLFTDADTRHAPDLVGRMVNLRAQRGAELLSVAGRQDMETIWEQAVQPSVFTLILARYGGARQLERATHPRDVVANGQCFMLSRAMYDQLGGHDAVKAYVAEDLMMAQRVLLAGGVVSMGLGVAQLRTRMYDGMRPLMKGWGKNIVAGGRHAMWGGPLARRWLFPLLILAFPMAILGPFLGLALGAWLGSGALLSWAAASAAAVLVAAAVANVLNGDPAWRAIYAPLGGLVLLVICITAVRRGDRVEWKGREYVAG
jgi:chlorobactene glucosyltransferase